MSDQEGPWTQPPNQPAPKARLGPLFWIALVGMVTIAALSLNKLFPGEVDQSASNWARAVLLGALVAGMLVRLRLSPSHAARQIGLWLGIVAALVVGYAYRSDLKAVGQRVRGELSPSHAIAAGQDEIVVARNDEGHFALDALVNGHSVRFLVDTGASGILLSPQDARRVGIDTDTLTYSRRGETANGIGWSAPFTADAQEVGGLRLSGVEMDINQAPISVSLLGMSFLNRLGGFRVEGDRLYLSWRK